MSPEQTSPGPPGQPPNEPSEAEDQPAKPPASAYTPEEEAIIKKRLQDLGYL